MGILLLPCVCDSTVAKMACGHDSIMVKLCERGCLSITEIHHAGTNCQDVYIVLIICVAAVLVAYIAKQAILSWKNAELEAKEKEQTAQKTKEEENSERKQKADLLDKYLDFLKNNASKDDNWIQNYKEILSNFKPSLQDESKKCEVFNNNIIESDKNKIIDILEEQMEFLKTEGLKSNAKAETKYKQTLAYLIEKSQKGEMNQITQKGLLCEQKEEPSPTPEKS